MGDARGFCAALPTGDDVDRPAGGGVLPCPLLRAPHALSAYQLRRWFVRRQSDATPDCPHRWAVRPRSRAGTACVLPPRAGRTLSLYERAQAQRVPWCVDRGLATRWMRERHEMRPPCHWASLAGATSVRSGLNGRECR